jgi:hypothetical protein
MAGFANVKEVVDAELSGASRFSTWRKSPSQVTTSRIWFDLSMSPGNPVPKYWFDAPPLIAKAVAQSTDGGLFHGGSVSPLKKYLRETTQIAIVATALPMPMILCDYLIYYPSIDDSTLDPQVMDNTVTLPRYSDGEGVQMIALSVAGRTGGQTFSVTYTNSEGVAGRVTPNVPQNSAPSIGSIITSNGAAVNTAGPFITLQQGDTGVRSIESVTMNGADVGLFTIILVKPLAQTQIRGIDAPVEKDYLLQTGTLPEIKDDAYLSWIVLPQGSLAATTIHGIIKVIWN